MYIIILSLKVFKKKRIFALQGRKNLHSFMSKKCHFWSLLGAI